MKIVFPEFNNQNIKAALQLHRTLLDEGSTLPDFADPNFTPIEAIPAQSLDEACELIKSHQADSLIAGVDYSSRDVILACRDHFGMAKRPRFSSQPIRQLIPPEQVQTTFISNNSAENELYSTFSGLAVMQKVTPESTQTYLLADMAACKHPTKSQLIDIIWQTYHSAKTLLADEPRLALLSFSTLGSGGHDDFISLAEEIVPYFREQGVLIDGEMQLDAAVNPIIGEKKAPNSPVAGHANVLIAPDLNAGNLLYKSFEQFGSFTVAGPILQGFNFPVSDLSRGSTTADIVLTIEVISRLAKQSQ